MSIYSKLSEARAKFHALKLSKTGHNKFAGYYYFELGDFIIPALSVFRECGIVSVISFDKETAYMSLIDIDKPDDRIVITSPMSSAALKGAHEIQNLGAVQTYLRRYLWVAAMEIVEHDAIDSSKPVDKPEAARAPIIPASPRIILSPEDEEFLSGMATDITGMCIDGQSVQALQMIRASALDGEQQIALNNMLDSKTRSALKKAKELTQQKEAA